MPAVPPKSDEWFKNEFQSHDKRISSLETKQNFAVRDAKNIVRVRGGLLPTGDFGLQVLDINGVGAELLPLYWAQLTGSVSTSGASYADLGFPSTTLIVGASGNLKVTVSSLLDLGLTAGAQGGQVGVSVDGGAPSSPLGGIVSLAQNVSAGSVRIAASLSATVVATGLTPGSHTVKCLFGGSGVSGACAFSNTFMQAQPL